MWGSTQTEDDLREVCLSGFKNCLSCANIEVYKFDRVPVHLIWNSNYYTHTSPAPLYTQIKRVTRIQIRRVLIV